MTALAFILGCIPLWVAHGAGGVSRQIIGTVVIGGMLAASFIAIFMIPVTFAVVERVSHRFSKRSREEHREARRREKREPVHSGGGM